MAGAGQLSQIFSKIGGSFSLGGGTSVGLSIGTSSIKLVELKKSGKAWKLLHFGIVQLPEDVIVNREIMNAVAVTESIRSLTQQLRLGSKEVCTSVSGAAVITKRMTVEVPNMKELQDQVLWEAEQYLPFDVSEVVMDFQLLSKGKDRTKEVMLVAVKRALIESYMGCIADAGLKPKVVDVDYFAMQNAYESNHPVSPSEAVAIVDIGASSLKMVIVQGGLPLFTKDSALGGGNLTTEIQKQLNLKFADAETLKTSGQGNGMPQEVLDLMQIMAENFATEIKRALDFYNASSVGPAVSSVLLCGGSSKLPHLSKICEETIGVPVQMINPFHSISYDASIFTPEYIEAIAPIAAIPIGLAIRAGSR